MVVESAYNQVTHYCFFQAHVGDTKDRNKLLPSGSFVTCSSDNTVRIWNYETHSSSDKSTRKCNFYSSVCVACLL